MVVAFIIGGFLAAAVVITDITWKGRNKSSRNLLFRGMFVLLIGGLMGIFWSTAFDYPNTGQASDLFVLIGYLGQLLSMYTAVLASALVRTAWAEGHTPVSEQKQNQ